MCIPAQFWKKKKNDFKGGVILILGIDPGLAATGWGIIRNEGNTSSYLDSGIIRTAAATDHIERLETIRAEINNIACRWQPQIVAIERVFANVNGKTSMNLGEARGVIVATILNCQIKIMEISALQIKKSMTGMGRADKKQVAQMVVLLLQNPPTPPPTADAADALACALSLLPLVQLQQSRLPPIRSRPRRRRQVSRR